MSFHSIRCVHCGAVQPEGALMHNAERIAGEKGWTYQVAPNAMDKIWTCPKCVNKKEVVAESKRTLSSIYRNMRNDVPEEEICDDLLTYPVEQNVQLLEESADVLKEDTVITLLSNDTIAIRKMYLLEGWKDSISSQDVQVSVNITPSTGESFQKVISLQTLGKIVSQGFLPEPAIGGDE